MSRCKHTDPCPRFLAVDLELQLHPGTLEHVPNHPVHHQINLSRFDTSDKNDLTGSKACSSPSPFIDLFGPGLRRKPFAIEAVDAQSCIALVILDISRGIGTMQTQQYSGTDAAMCVWYYCKNGAQYGPVTLGELEAKVDRGELFDTTRVWKSGMPEWTKLNRLPDLSAKFETVASIPESERTSFGRFKSLLAVTIKSARETAGKSS